MRLTKHMTALPTLLFTITYFAHWYKRRRQRKAIEMRIAMLLRLGLMFSVTAALVYSQEVHYNFDRGANFAASEHTSGSRPRVVRPRPMPRLRLENWSSRALRRKPACSSA